LGEKEKDKITDPRFIIYPDNNMEPISFVPGIGDPQMLFLANNVSRMKNNTPLGTRIVEVHNGSSLFTGNAGGGESNLRRYIIENDLLEAIIAMPEKDFYNTGIGTFIWVVTNRKEERRRGKVQLIDATAIKTPLRKNLGEKNCQTDKADRKKILELLMDFQENEQSRIFPNEEFGFWEITVLRPLRLRVLPDADYSELKKEEVEICSEALSKVPADTPLDHWNKYCKALNLPKALKNKLKALITVKDENAVAVEGEADKDLTDTEQVPFLYEGGIDGFMQNEVRPYVPDAYIDETKTKVGYEISFTKYFYKPVELRPIDEIKAELVNIQNSAEQLRKLIME
jgi:type I restriction enzyme M protein